MASLQLPENNFISNYDRNWSKIAINIIFFPVKAEIVNFPKKIQWSFFGAFLKTLFSFEFDRKNWIFNMVFQISNQFTAIKKLQKKLQYIFLKSTQFQLSLEKKLN